VTVVFLHALPLDERMWRAGAEAPRLYGLGRTMDEWAEAILDAYPGRLILAGASMGGYCALALARRAPERVHALLLVGARPDADSEERRAGRADTIDLIRNEGPEALWRSMVPKLFHDESKADEGQLYRDPDGLVGAVEAIRDREDSTDVARTFEGQLQFVAGEFDPFVSADELAGFDVRELASAGHLVNVERPDEFNEILRDFLARV
jgi:pimeloyl-ACP methyl ester carboxylesterase